MPLNRYRLILASASPRRRQLFTEAGYVFESADPGEIEEDVKHASSPEELAMLKASAKASAIALKLKPPYPALVVGADTIVVAHGRIIGKPLDRADAVAILSSLSGTRHEVITGVCILPLDAALNAERGDEPSELTALEFAEETWVTMRKMSAEEIAAYVNSGESDGKAGAYAIQEHGDKFVERLEGSLSNVVGFPMESFRQALPEFEAQFDDLFS